MDLAEIDHRAFDRVAAAKLRGLESVLPRLSAAADHGKLWYLVAAGLAVTGRPSLRRAATRGLIGIALASPTVNIVGKQIFRRRRPLIDNVPVVRVHRIPRSPSFPSGHTASAVAFAAGVAMEATGRTALPVAGLAAAVGFSRVYTGAHYPGDVLAGAASGLAAALVTRLIWPVSAPAEVVPLERSVESVDPSGDGVVVVVNGDDGIEEQLRGELPGARFESSGELEERLERAAGAAKVLAVGGGDGTVGAGAAVALKHDIPLLVLPVGTLNHFSRTLGIETVSDALNAYRSGNLSRVDVGTVNGVPFLNNAGFGIYPEVVRRREKLERRLGKWPALAVSTLRALRHTSPVSATVDGHSRRVWLAFVGNCTYRSHGTVPTTRAHMDDGILDVRVVSARRGLGKPGAFAAVLTGSHRLGYEKWAARSLNIEPSADRLLVSHDGEISGSAPPVVFDKHPKGLAVFVPAP
ncbi:bifunctional phosphatase PAP2/diacylglycerol kinase family protein [Actinocorallia sp. A-T 12471]|uniref:bifunctional phosphatase PAP2/diacylglycerol kinase family protein n=1 Tax=Actinocorallia sp. A-T 12471 TaxID=3089813 RepID=UPI0029D0BDBC|nr:phosphatase PAP2 family protein [Actinocorallia sp. A-T 12471]MDX6741860.1 phosphatase PAP2 family protein [Actinocorallia sp. A-T 12471]